MKVIDRKTTVTIAITILVLMAFLLLDNKSYAYPSNVPEITSFESSA